MARRMAPFLDEDEDSDDAPEEVANLPSKELKAKDPEKQSEEVNKSNSKQKTKPAPALDVSDEGRAKLSDEAVSAVVAGISDSSKMLEGKCFILPDWAKLYKPVLGPYRKFLESHKDKFTVVENDLTKYGPGFTVWPAKETAPALSIAKDAANWQKLLNMAWCKYCKETPKLERDFPSFFTDIQRMFNKNGPSVKKIKGARSVEDKGKVATSKVEHAAESKAPKAKKQKKKSMKQKKAVESEEAPKAKKQKKQVPKAKHPWPRSCDV